MAVSFNDISNMANVMSSAGARYNAAEDARARTGLAARGLGLEERKQRFAEKGALIKRAQADLSNLDKQMIELATGGARDLDPVGTEKAIRTIANSKKRIYMGGGADEATANQLVEADIQRIMAMPTVVQQGALEGTAKGTSTAAESAADPMTARERQAGASRDEAAAAASRANAAATQQDMASDIQSFYKPGTNETENLRTSDPAYARKAEALMASGFRQMRTPGIEATTASDLSGLTTATESRLQQNQFNAVEGIAALDRVVEGLQGTPEAVGLAGNIIQTVQNDFLAQFNSSAFNPEVSEVRENIRLARESLLRDVSDDNRFNKDDRKMISNALPETGIFESQPEAISKARMVAAMIARRLAASAQLGIDEASRILPQEDIQRMFMNGTIDKETAIHLLQAIHGAP